MDSRQEGQIDGLWTCQGHRGSAQPYETLDFTIRNAYAITYLNLAVFNLPRNSAETDSLQLKDFSAGDLGLYSDFHHPRQWDRRAVRTFLATEFKTEPAIRKILQRDPPFFSSNHAALLLKTDKRYAGYQQ